MFGPEVNVGQVSQGDPPQELGGVTRPTEDLTLSAALHVLRFSADSDWKKVSSDGYRAAMEAAVGAVDSEDLADQFFEAVDYGRRRVNPCSTVEECLRECFQNGVSVFLTTALERGWREATSDPQSLNSLPNSMAYLFIVDPERYYGEKRADFLARYISSMERPEEHLRLDAAHAHREWVEAGNPLGAEAKMLLGELTQCSLLERISSGLGGITGRSEYREIDSTLKHRYALAIALSPISFEARDFLRKLRDREVSPLDTAQRGVAVKCSLDWIQSFPEKLEKPMEVLEARQSSVEEAALAVKALQGLAAGAPLEDETCQRLSTFLPDTAITAWWQRICSHWPGSLPSNIRASALAALVLAEREPRAARTVQGLRSSSVFEVRQWFEKVEARLAFIGGLTVPRAERGQSLNQVSDADAAGT